MAKRELKKILKYKAYYVEFGTKGTVATIYATSLSSAKKKAKSQLNVRARGGLFSIDRSQYKKGKPYNPEWMK